MTDSDSIIPAVEESAPELPQVIILNGASSSGKTSLAKALQWALNAPYFYYSSDLLVDGGMLSPHIDRNSSTSPNSWKAIRPKFFEAFDNSIRAFVDAGIYIIVDHIIEYPSWLKRISASLSGVRVMYIGVQCHISELERRELHRGDREIGEARSHVEDGIYRFSDFDLVVDTTNSSPRELASALVKAIGSFNYETSVMRRIALGKLIVNDYADWQQCSETSILKG